MLSGGHLPVSPTGRLRSTTPGCVSPQSVVRSVGQLGAPPTNRRCGVSDHSPNRRRLLTGCPVRCPFSCSVGFYTLVITHWPFPQEPTRQFFAGICPRRGRPFECSVVQSLFRVIYKPPSRIMVHIQNIPNRLHPVGIVFIRAFTELPRLCCSVVRCCCTSLFSCCFFCWSLCRKGECMAFFIPRFLSSHSISGLPAN